MRIGIIGCAGRVGRMLLAELIATDELAGGLVRPDSRLQGADLGVLAGGQPIGLLATHALDELAAQSDVLIDFSSAGATAAHVEQASAAGTPIVLGVTGLDAAQQEVVGRAAQVIPVVQAANTSIGVNLLSGLVEKVAATLGDEFDIEIVEMHHRHKVDAPSGTALLLGAAAAAGRGVELDAVAERGRDGYTGARQPGRIGMAALRGGDVVGDHSVYFAADGERLVLSHLASDRRIYARGAIRAARWLEGRQPGLYGMKDVLGLA